LLFWFVYTHNLAKRWDSESWRKEGVGKKSRKRGGGGKVKKEVGKSDGGKVWGEV